LALSLQQSAMHGRGFGKAMTGFPQSREVVARLAFEPLGIGFAAGMRASEAVRAVAIAAGEHDVPVALTPEHVAAGTYPLDRFLLIYVQRPISPLARDFLMLMLSKQGQDAVAGSPQGYIPLSAREAAAERAKLD
jgi:phosphate transport system substrate-binding protein